MTETTAVSTPTGVGAGITGMLNVFVDPAMTAARVNSRVAWIWPTVILVLAYLIIGQLMLPYTLQLMNATLAQREVPADTLEKTRSAMQVGARVTSYVMPIVSIGFLALFALLIKAMYGIMNKRPRFREVFTLLACCSLIPMLQAIATIVVLRAKGDPIESPVQMTPPFGADIFFPNLHGPLLAILGFFSLFQIWFIVVLVVGLAALTKSSKSQALFASSPACVIPLCLRVVGSLFQK